MTTDWDDLRFFLAVARSGGLTAAAAGLKVGVATVGRKISNLERSLAATLFERRQTGYFLTDEGRVLLSRAEAVEERVIALERGADGLRATIQGSVRIALAETHANDVIIPALPRLRARHPHLSVSISTGISSAGLSRREADIALRVVRPDECDLITRRLCGHACALYASREYLVDHPWRDETRFAGHALIGWESEFEYLAAARWLAKAAVGVQPAVRTTNLRAQLVAARSGLGLAVLPAFLADPHEELVRLLPPELVFIEDMWLVFHADFAHSARVRAVADFITETVLAARRRFEGLREASTRQEFEFDRAKAVGRVINSGFVSAATAARASDKDQIRTVHSDLV